MMEGVLRHCTEMSLDRALTEVGKAVRTVFLCRVCPARCRGQFLRFQRAP